MASGTSTISQIRTHCSEAELSQMPLLRWAGSKKKLLPLLQKAAPPKMRRYIEPFAGSAVLYLKLRPKSAILSDINEDLIHAYTVVREDPDMVWRKASSWPTDDAFYYELRARDPENMGDKERAARFVYLNRFCFNGVYRTNRDGKFNVARGQGHLGIPTKQTFRAFAERLRVVDLRCTDFLKTVRRAGKGDFIYLDPPYAVPNTRDRGEYGPGSFKQEDLDRLTEGLLAASQRGAKVLLSYSDRLDVEGRFKGWYVRKFEVTRNVCGFVDSRRRAGELLVSNYEW